MIKTEFANVQHWVFDLDNTLYHPEARLFDQIEVHMVAYVMEALGVDEMEANRLRTLYWREYGTTLAGLMDLHGVDPGPYLTTVHEISLDHLEPAPVLAAAITALPGQKIVYTNGSAPYARRVLAARGLDGLFDDVYGVEDAAFRPKPERVAFETVFAKAKIDPTYAAMFEDDPRNLRAPHEMGLRTVLVHSDHPGDDHIHHSTHELDGFLSQVA